MYMSSLEFQENPAVPPERRKYYYHRYLDNDDMVFGYILNGQAMPEGIYTNPASFRQFENRYASCKEDWETLIVIEKECRGIP